MRSYSYLFYLFIALCLVVTIGTKYGIHYGVVLLYVLIFVGIMFIKVKNRLLAQASNSWHSTTGRITHSEVIGPGIRIFGRDISLDEGGKYRAKIEYEYDVNGRRYTGDKIFLDYAVSSCNYIKSCQKFVDKYPGYKTVEIFYNPNDPSECVLEKGSTKEGTDLLINTTIMFVIGLAFLLGTLPWYGIFALIFFNAKMHKL